MSRRKHKYSIIGREFVDLPNKVVRRHKRRSKKQMAEYKRHRSQCGTATTAKTAAGIRGRRRPPGTIASFSPERITPIDVLLEAMTPKGLPEPHYRIG
jgi:hypothetical protein